MVKREVHAVTAEIRVTTHRAGIVHEGDPSNPRGRSVSSTRPVGGTADSTIDETGVFAVSLQGPLELSDDNEPYVLKALRDRLRRNGRQAEVVKVSSTEREKRDASGEDGRLMVDGTEVSVQVVTVPADASTWADVRRRGQSEILMSLDEFVGQVRAALEHKRRYSNHDTVLALDSTHFAAAVGPRLVDTYLEKFGDPEQEYGWAAVWVVGPSATSTCRIRGSADA